MIDTTSASARRGIGVMLALVFVAFVVGVVVGAIVATTLVFAAVGLLG